MQDNADNEVDELILDALKLIVKEGVCNCVFLQRKLNIGYVRAKNIVDQLLHYGFIKEKFGYDVVITEEELQKILKES